MNFIRNIFKAKEAPIQSNDDFWNWFCKNEKKFYKLIKESGNLEKDFFDKLSPKLNELKDGFFYVTGMYDDSTAELVLTADGIVKNIVFVEELVKSAPDLDGWKFTALKPALEIKDVSIKMAGFDFNKDNLSFYSNELAEYPDEIDITVIHDDYNEENKAEIINGIYIFLDNYLGELDFAISIDNLKFTGKKDIEKELIPIDKLKDFLSWRQKEFIEKYHGLRYDTENDSYSLLEADLENGTTLIAVVNKELLQWDTKASHPWISILTLKYDGCNNNGMPNEEDYKLLDIIEEKIMLELRDLDGYLNIGRQTANGEREINFACKDFRKPSKIFFEIQKQYSDNFEIEYDIFKDKYWQSFSRFIPSL